MEQHLTQYRIFYAVARAGNISRAAKELLSVSPRSANQSASWKKASAWHFLSAIPAVSP